VLVLTRKLMEKVFIGDHICLTVVRIEGGQVRLGIEAPREVSVVRAELIEPTGHAKAGPQRPTEPITSEDPRRSIRLDRNSYRHRLQ
jgi:carbon storage regulator